MSTVYEALLKVGSEKRSASDVLIRSDRFKLPLLTILAFTLLFFVVVNQLVAHVMRRQMEETAVILVSNLSDAAAMYVASKDLLRLNTAVTKYAMLSRVAYAAVRDREGGVIAESPRGVSSAIEQEVPSGDGKREINRRQIKFNGQTVYETSAPILDGQLGTAHIGVSADAVDSEIYRLLLLFVWPLAFGILAAGLVLTIGTRLLLNSFWARRTYQ